MHVMDMLSCMPISIAIFDLDSRSLRFYLQDEPKAAVAPARIPPSDSVRVQNIVRFFVDPMTLDGT